MLKVNTTNTIPNFKKIQGYKSNVKLPQKDEKVSFKGNPNFVLVNHHISVLNQSAETNHITNVLKNLGVRELELGDNIYLARLLKKALYRVKMLGYEVPSRIRCESDFFQNNVAIQQQISSMKTADSYFDIPGAVSWDGVNVPILYLNPKSNWIEGNGCLTFTKDSRQPMWHEIAHYLHMVNYKTKPREFFKLDDIPLSSYQKNIIRETIGEYAATSPKECVAEIFARLMSGEAYNSLHPEVFNIYKKYNGPMPKAK